MGIRWSRSPFLFQLEITFLINDGNVQTWFQEANLLTVLFRERLVLREVMVLLAKMVPVV